MEVLYETKMVQHNTIVTWTLLCHTF